jgi:hypothetical protein
MIIISRRLSYRLPDDIMGLWDYPMETIRLRDPISNTGQETCDRSPRKRLKAQAVECATSRDPRFRSDLPGQVHNFYFATMPVPFFELDKTHSPGKMQMLSRLREHSLRSPERGLWHIPQLIFGGHFPRGERTQSISALARVQLYILGNFHLDRHSPTVLGGLIRWIRVESRGFPEFSPQSTACTACD